MYISLYDLALFILFAGLVIIGIYVIAVLRRILCLLRTVRGFLDKHQEDIDESVPLFKETLSNLNELTVSLKETTDQTNRAVRAFPVDITDTIDDLRDSFEAFAYYAKLAKDVVKSVFSKAA